MNRFEKIVAEQLKRGDIGTAVADSALISKLKNKFKYGVTVYIFIDRHGSGRKYPPLTADEVINLIPNNKGYINYSNGEYIFVIDDQNPQRGKKETIWDVYIINKNKTFPNISDQVFAENKSGLYGQSFIITFAEYELLLKKQNELVAADKPAVDKPAVDPIQQQKAAVDAVITKTIDVNNLGKGTDDADAFQELLYQVGLKLIPTYTSFKKFASYRTKGPDGGWDGDIGPATLNMLDKLSLKDKYKSGDIAGVIKDLRGSLLTTESTNYFKGTGMNIKLKDLLREQIIIKPDDEVTGGGKTTPKTTSSTNFTPDTFPANYTGKGKITYKDGDTFEGSWENSKKSGPGIYKSPTGRIYAGPWSNGKKNGEFKITYLNGDIRVGTFINDVLGGPVTLTKKGGKPVEETWKDGKKLLGIDDLYTQSVTDMSAVLLQLVNYVNNHEQFAGYKKTVNDDEENALIDLVKPWVQSNIQPKVTAHYNKYIKPYMSQYNVSDAALTVEYDWEYVGTNSSVTNIPNDKFRKIFQNYLILKANSSDTALDHPADSAAYYNYAGDKSSYTIPCMFFYNYEGSVHYWSLAGGRAVFNVDTDF